MWSLAVEGAAADADAVLGALWALGVNGVELEDEDTGGPPGRARARVWLEAGVDQPAVAAAVEVGARARGATGPLRLDWAPVALAPLRGSWPLARSFRVYPLGGPPPRPGRRAPLVVDPAAAWGDGRHGSTRAAAALLEAQAAQLAGARALDFGCGAGLLSLVLQHLGADTVLAVDHDGLAREATARAGAVGPAPDRLTVRADAPVGAVYDVVVANLPHLVLVELAPALAAQVAPGGALLLAGCARSLWPAVVARLPGWRVEVARRSGAFGAWWLRPAADPQG
ncbi:MAG: 50S ribosomal protein L11 methyltransferase [Deltaproteobacteria bacterium]|nr:50S ribosomal protein L11 methyltransferase [Deltaproteobacteria bacterium]